MTRGNEKELSKFTLRVQQGVISLGVTSLKSSTKGNLPVPQSVRNWTFPCAQRLLSIPSA